MSVLTDTEKAAVDFVEQRKPDQTVGGVPLWAWSAVYSAFIAGAEMARKESADFIREKSAEVYGPDANVVEHEEAALWLEGRR